MTKFPKNIFVCSFVALVTVLLDQLSKEYAQSSLEYVEAIDIFEGLRFNLVYNSGAAFGVLSQQSGWQILFLIAISTVAILAISIWIFIRSEEAISNLLPLALILGGAAGNLIDRFRFGFVVDFITVYYESWFWPTFNLADSAICIGVFLLLIDSLRAKPVS